MSAFFAFIESILLNLQQNITTMAKKEKTIDLNDKDLHDYLDKVFQKAKTMLSPNELRILKEGGIDKMDAFIDSLTDMGIDKEALVQAYAEELSRGEDGWKDGYQDVPMDDPGLYDSYEESITKVFHDTKPQEFHLRIKF